MRSARQYGGSFDRFWEDFRSRPAFSKKEDDVLLNDWCMAACYSTDEDGTVRLPFDVATGKLVDEVWQRWLEKDPVRMIPDHADEMRSMRAIWVDAGTEDEWFLDNGAVAVSKELEAIGVEHTLELFDAGHMGIGYRYPRSLAFLATALAQSGSNCRYGRMEPTATAPQAEEQGRKDPPMSQTIAPPSVPIHRSRRPRRRSAALALIAVAIAVVLVLVAGFAAIAITRERTRGGRSRSRCRSREGQEQTYAIHQTMDAHDLVGPVRRPAAARWTSRRWSAGRWSRSTTTARPRSRSRSRR